MNNRIIPKEILIIVVVVILLFVGFNIFRNKYKSTQKEYSVSDSIIRKNFTKDTNYNPNTHTVTVGDTTYEIDYNNSK